jgi:cyclase
MEKLISDNGIIGCGAGSLFVFKGVYRAVLINYPDVKRRLEIMKEIIKHQKVSR